MTFNLLSRIRIGTIVFRKDDMYIQRGEVIDTIDESGWTVHEVLWSEPDWISGQFTTLEFDEDLFVLER